MGKLTTVFLAIGIALAMTSIAGADATSSSRAVLDWNTLSFDYTGTDFTVDWLFNGSFSEASAQDKHSAYSEDDMASPGWATTSANAVVPNAWGEAWTGDPLALGVDEVGEEVYAATTGHGLFWAESWANAERGGVFQFQADGAGTLTVSIDYSLEQDLTTGVFGDVAEGYSAVELGLTNWTAFQYADDFDDMWGDVVDGASLSDSRSGTLTVSLGFADGAVGYGELWMEVDNEAYVESVPLPGAVLLGMIGLSVAGVKLRKSV